MIDSINTVKLTEYSNGLGCASKMQAEYLLDVLADMPKITNPDVLIGNDTSDDAAVYKLTNELAIVQTVDFFAPIVNDPYSFGQIAAANAISDIYAMGAKPVFALNVVAFPEKSLPREVLKQILKGAQDKATEAGINILGGHTVKDDEPKFGMTVTGIIHPDKIMDNSHAQPDDVVILTKPLGTGIITTGMKKEITPPDIEKRAIETMSKLNNIAAEVVHEFPVSSCTDVTGFGLLGHFSEMTRGSHVDAEIYFDKLPFIKGLFDLPIIDLIAGGTKNNKEFVEDKVVYREDFSDLNKLIINDAQTSGGLLISLQKKHADNFILKCKEKGLNDACIIGRIIEKGKGTIYVK